MKKTITLLVVLMMVLVGGVVRGNDEHHLKSELVPIPPSTVSGFVQLVEKPDGETMTHVIAMGLEPGMRYSSFYYSDTLCMEDAERVGDVSEIANAGGVALFRGSADEGIDEIGSISIRLGPGYGTLLACAVVSPRP